MCAEIGAVPDGVHATPTRERASARESMCGNADTYARTETGTQAHADTDRGRHRAGTGAGTRLARSAIGMATSSSSSIWNGWLFLL